MTITAADHDKIRNLFDEGVQTLGDISSLQEGLKDTVAAIAEELDIKPAVLMNAIKLEFKRAQGKGSIDDEQDKVSLIEELIVAAGRRH